MRVCRRLLGRTGPGTIAAGALLAPPWPHAVAAHAASPGPGALLRIEDRLVRADRVRIATSAGLVEAGGVRANAEGLAYGAIVSSTRRDTLPAPGSLAWEAILEDEVSGSRAGRGAIVGGLIPGTGLGTLSAIAGGGPGVQGPITGEGTASRSADPASWSEARSASGSAPGSVRRSPPGIASILLRHAGEVER